MTIPEDAARLVTPRPFEPDYQLHMERLMQDELARQRLESAGVDVSDVWRLRALAALVG